MTIPPKIQKWIDHTRVSMRELIWAGTIILGGVAWVDSRYVHAADFKQYQYSMERRILEGDKRRLEQEVLKLEVKRETYPQEFNAIDKAMLRKNNEQLRQITDELKLLNKAK